MATKHASTVESSPMANPRLPVAKAKATGAEIKNPGRHKHRANPVTAPLGKPSDFLPEAGKRAWEGFKRELPWLMESDRSMVEVAAKVRGELMTDPDVSVTKLSMLQAILSKLGADPTNRSKVLTGGDDEKEADEFFGVN